VGGRKPRTAQGVLPTTPCPNMRLPASLEGTPPDKRGTGGTCRSDANIALWLARFPMVPGLGLAGYGQRVSGYGHLLGGRTAHFLALSPIALRHTSCLRLVATWKPDADWTATATRRRCPWRTPGRATSSSTGRRRTELRPCHQVGTARWWRASTPRTWPARWWRPRRRWAGSWQSWTRRRVKSRR
jgi:hypothetical protein